MDSSKSNYMKNVSLSKSPKWDILDAELGTIAFGEIIQAGPLRDLREIFFYFIPLRRCGFVWSSYNRLLLYLVILAILDTPRAGSV